MKWENGALIVSVATFMFLGVAMFSWQILSFLKLSDLSIEIAYEYSKLLGVTTGIAIFCIWYGYEKAKDERTGGYE